MDIQKKLQLEEYQQETNLTQQVDNFAKSLDLGDFSKQQKQKWRFYISRYYQFVGQYWKSIAQIYILLNTTNFIQQLKLKTSKMINLFCFLINQPEESHNNILQMRTLYVDILKTAKNIQTDELIKQQIVLFASMLMFNYHKYLEQQNIGVNLLQVAQYVTISKLADSYRLQIEINTQNKRQSQKYKLSTQIISKSKHYKEQILKNSSSAQNNDVRNAEEQDDHFLLKPLMQAIGFEKENYLAQKNTFLYFLQQKQRSHSLSSVHFLNLSSLYISNEEGNHWLKLFKQRNYIHINLNKWNHYLADQIGVSIKMSRESQSEQLIQNYSVQYEIKQIFLQFQTSPEWKGKSLSISQIKLQTGPKIVNNQIDNSLEHLGLNNQLLTYPQVDKNKDKTQLLSVPSDNQNKDGYNRGLRNTGNTCYLNSALQCLHKSRPFTQRFQIQLKQKLTEKKPQQLKLSKCIQEFIMQMWIETDPFVPTEIKKITGEQNYIFKGNEQNDSVELLITLFSIFNQELNDPIKDKPMKELRPIDSDSQQEIFIKARARDQHRINSVISRTFSGRYKTVFRCLKCLESRSCIDQIKFELFNVHYIDLPVPKTKSELKYSKNMKYSLQQLLDKSQKAEYMKGVNALRCKKCNMQQDTAKFMLLYQLNSIFSICIRRFYEGNKNEAIVKVPYILQFNKVRIKDKMYQVAKYRLYAAILHRGNHNSGHYTALCWNYKIKKWTLYNDALLEVFDAFVDINLDDAYALFYEFIEEKQHIQQTKKLQKQKEGENNFRRQQQIKNRNDNTTNNGQLNIQNKQSPSIFKKITTSIINFVR